MSRVLIVLAFVLQAIAFPSAASEIDSEATVPEINLQEPPFWMPSYDEFKDLQLSQKNYYIKNVLPTLKKIPGLEKVSQTKLEEASEWYKSWDGLRRQVYVACLKDSLAKACDAVADVRIKTLDSFSVKKNASPGL